MLPKSHKEKNTELRVKLRAYRAEVRAYHNVGRVFATTSAPGSQVEIYTPAALTNAIQDLIDEKAALSSERAAARALIPDMHWTTPSKLMDAGHEMMLQKNISDLQVVLYVVRSHAGIVGPSSSPKLRRLLALTNGDQSLCYLRGGKDCAPPRRLGQHQREYGNDIDLVFMTPVTCVEKAERWLHGDFKLDAVAIVDDWIAVTPAMADRLMVDLSLKMNQGPDVAPPVAPVPAKFEIAKANKEILTLRDELDKANKTIGTFIGGAHRLSLFKTVQEDANEQRGRVAELEARLESAEKEVKVLKRKRESDPETRHEALGMWLDSFPKYICRKCHKEWLLKNDLDDGKFNYPSKSSTFSDDLSSYEYTKSVRHSVYDQLYKKNQ